MVYLLQYLNSVGAERPRKFRRDAAQSTPAETRGRRARELTVLEIQRVPCPPSRQRELPVTAPGQPGIEARHMKVSVRTLARVLAPAALCFAAACSSDAATGATTPPPAQTGGWLTLQLVTPNSDDGAAQFSVRGPAIDSVKLLGYDGFATIESGSANLVVTGLVGSGNVAQVHVPDLSLASEYQASIDAAAARQTYVLQSLTGYRAVLVR